MATQTPNVPTVLFHVLLTLITGGAWLIVLLIWHILKKN